MKLTGSLNRWMFAGLVMAASLASIAPAALADRGRDRGEDHVRYKDVRSWAPSRFERPRGYVRGSGAGPAFAGLVGGFLLGDAFAHAQPVERVVYVHDYAPPPPPRYRYYDVYEDQTFDSLDDCQANFHGRHAHIVKVIDNDDRCVQTLRWAGDRWLQIDDQGQSY